MAQSINIGGWPYTASKLVKITFVSSMTSKRVHQSGEKPHEKHCFDNPNKPIASLFLALGIWFSHEASHFGDTKKLFQTDNNKPNAASQQFCTELSKLFT
jgi:hypothetical protein